MFREATPSDLDRIAEIYEELHTAQENGDKSINTGWKRGVYPSRDTAIEAINIGDMFVEAHEDIIVASARINNEQLKEYKVVPWEYPAPDNEVMVLHTLAVSPKTKRMGFGAKFVDFYEKYAIENGCFYLRIDTWEENFVARGLYKKLGYREYIVG